MEQVENFTTSLVTELIFMSFKHQKSVANFFEDSNVFMVVKSLEPKYETPYGPQNSCCQMALSSNILGSNIMRVKNLYVENIIFDLKTLSSNMSTIPLRQWGSHRLELLE